MMKFVKVHFNHNTAEKEYTFITEIDLQPDDIVVVDTRHGMTLATVISLTDTLAFPGPGGYEVCHRQGRYDSL